jgi:hypothetical protein
MSSILKKSPTKNKWRFARDFWRYHMSRGDLQTLTAENVSNWKGASNCYEDAIKVAQNAGYLDFERLAQERYALAYDSMANIVASEKAPLDENLLALQTQKATFEKQKIALERELKALIGKDGEEAKQAEVSAKTAEIASKISEIEGAQKEVDAKTKDLADLVKVRDAALYRASRLELGCELRKASWIPGLSGWEAAWDPKGIDALQSAEPAPVVSEVVSEVSPADNQSSSVVVAGLDNKESEV